jgi:hypothetical protein
MEAPLNGGNLPCTLKDNCCMKKLLSICLFLICLSGCERNDCQICTVYAPETLIIRTFIVCGNEVDKYQNKESIEIVNGIEVRAKTTCRKY